MTGVTKRSLCLPASAAFSCAPEPAQVLIVRDELDTYFWLNLVLTLLGWLPGMIHAVRRHSSAGQRAPGSYKCLLLAARNRLVASRLSLPDPALLVPWVKLCRSGYCSTATRWQVGTTACLTLPASTSVCHCRTYRHVA